eukprot:CAMPEP_0181471232 /NCGR_PEP_ID=MMETSP1110-20121109/38967_1 /TAXON_ID=174948 /ORGANISM="Symbiodinium sp., Strain CCMP421" /LENGTH=57 /DNA_ID=CAMNT_0023596241 /DNA_START=143 /DNA_END=316 /DNA_ORIENTATION=+
MACVAAGLQNDALSSGTEVPRSARNMAAALNILGALVACMSHTQRQRFTAALHLAIA